MNTPSLIYRPYNDDDLPFIYNSWLKSLKKSIPWEFTKSTIYFNGMTKRLDKLLQRAGVIVACDPKNPSTIVGWMCAEWIDLEHDREPVMHFVYVKHPFRKFGVFRAFYGMMSGKDQRVPWSTHKAFKRYSFENDFTATDTKGNRKRFRKATVMVRQSMADFDNVLRTEFNPFLLDTIDSMVTIPCAHKTTL